MHWSIHDEAGHRWSVVLSEALLPVASKALVEYLGRVPDAPVHVILSDLDTHSARFPPRQDEIERLIQLDDDQGTPALQRYEWTLCAHGVCTVAATKQRPPVDVTAGDIAIYIDVDSCERLAEKYAVSGEAMVARVLVHELSHAVRGHATRSDGATHGWLREGDAQRDAWWVLTRLLGDEAWDHVARWGRAAQVRLAQDQPPAYRSFGPDDADRRDLVQHPPSDPPPTWIIRPVRDAYILAHEGLTEVPVSNRRHAPKPGDLVFLADDELTVGCWTVIGSTQRSQQNHPRHRKAIQTEWRKVGTEPDLAWLQLRPVEPLQGTRGEPPIDCPPRDLLDARQLRAEDRNSLVNQLTASAVTLVKEIAAERRKEKQRSDNDVIEVLEQESVEIPEGFPGPFDPLNDWDDQ